VSDDADDGVGPEVLTGLPQDWALRETALLREISDLSAALDAVRAGGIDAVIIPGPEGENLYTLTSTDRPYRVLVQEMGEGAATVSMRGVVLYANQRFADLVGHDRARLLGQDLTALVRARDATVLAELLATGAGDTAHKELTLLHPDGLSTPVLASVTGLDLGGGTLVRCLIVADLTDVVNARLEAQAGEAALRATVDSLLDPHVRVEAVRDQSGRIVDFVYVDANPAACAYNGLDYQDLVGARLLDLHPGSAGAGLLDQYRHVVQTGEPLMLDDIVYAQELMDGQERHYDIRAARVGDGLSYTWRDITDRHAAARRLAESEEHYRLLAENASDVVMHLSPDRRYQWVSGSIADVLGWAATDLLGHVIDEFIHPEELEQFRRAVADTSPDSTANSEFRFRRCDGSYRWVLCHTRLNLDLDGAPVALIGGLVDIEARKEVEAQELSRLETLERFQRLTVGRELKMIELKNEIKSLKTLIHGGGENGYKH
jgi:PAS domain S-box-containing protein